MGSLAYKPRRNTDKTDSESVALMHCEHASLTSADFTTSDVHKYMLDGGAMFISACKCIYFHLLVLNNIMHVHTNGVLFT